MRFEGRFHGTDHADRRSRRDARCRGADRAVLSQALGLMPPSTRRMRGLWPRFDAFTNGLSPTRCCRHAAAAPALWQCGSSVPPARQAVSPSSWINCSVRSSRCSAVALSIAASSSKSPAERTVRTPSACAMSCSGLARSRSRGRASSWRISGNSRLSVRRAGAWRGLRAGAAPSARLAPIRRGCTASARSRNCARAVRTASRRWSDAWHRRRATAMAG